jgi:hypothetical protein
LPTAIVLSSLLHLLAECTGPTIVRIAIDNLAILILVRSLAKIVDISYDGPLIRMCRIVDVFHLFQKILQGMDKAVIGWTRNKL